MKSIIISSVSGRRSLVIWTLFCVIAGATFLAYVCTSLANGRGEIVMPLDDVYIHFQYARQMAAGQPYVYNPGLPATSGATSFLYPYILAAGYLIGFHGLQLGLWAMAVGALAMTGAMWLVYKLVRVIGAGDVVAVLISMVFGLNGSVAWHFMSGMETGLVMLFMLGTLYAVITYDGDRLWSVIVWATALALIRPEGGLLAVVAMGAVGWKLWMARGLGADIKLPQPRWRQFGLLIPVAAIGVQPVVNVLLTGSAVASGNAAKSVLGAVPFYWDEVIRQIAENFVRMWVEFGTGISPREGVYIMPMLLVLALLGIGFLLVMRELRPVGVMLVLWLVGGTLMLATLDTAFWHFKRYQMPFMALLFPLAGWGISVVASFKRQAVIPPRRQDLLAERHRDIGTIGRNRINIAGVIICGMLLVSEVTSVQFLRYYGLNVGYVYAQLLQMARWLEANTPVDAVVAVHDVGMMRYMGGRTTLDMVGLTTKGAADYWRNGPGAVAEFLMQERPDYIASYGEGHGYGLGMIAETAIYGEPLASFLVELDDAANVALAANFQGIYKPDWAFMNEANQSLQTNLPNYWFNQSVSLGSVNVGNLASESKAHYSWRNGQRLAGFPTEVHQFNYISCAMDHCQIVDGGRLINGEESFRLPTLTQSGINDGVALITRLNPANAGTIDIYANGEFVGTRLIPAIPGQWLEVATCIPASIVAKSRTDELDIRIVPHVTDGYYMPYYHWLYGCSRTADKPTHAVSAFQNGAIQLSEVRIDYQADAAKLDVHLTWYTDGSATGDYKVFVHVYKAADQVPVAQADIRPGNGTLPPGNWLPGVLRDTITVDLQDIPAGQYQVAIGMYDPVTFERLQPTGGDEQGRLFIGEVEIKK